MLASGTARQQATAYWKAALLPSQQTEPLEQYTHPYSLTLDLDQKSVFLSFTNADISRSYPRTPNISNSDRLVMRSITTWTRFTVADRTVKLYDEYPDDWEGDNPPTEKNIEAGLRWEPVVKPLISAKGHRRSVWGRIKERPEQVLLITSWNSHDELRAFEASPGYNGYITALSESGPPSISYVQFRGRVHNYLVEKVAFHTIYFPHPVADEQRTVFGKSLGLQYGVMIGPNSDLPYRTMPISGWVDGVQELEGKIVETAIVCHFWRSDEDEQEFKEEAMCGATYENPIKIVDRWEEALRSCGAVEWTEEHIELGTVPQGFEDND